MGFSENVHLRPAPAARVRGQAAEELKDLSAEKEKAEEKCQTSLENAEKYMTNINKKKGLEWDGVRVRPKHNQEKVQHLVSAIEHGSWEDGENIRYPTVNTISETQTGGGIHTTVKPSKT